MSTSLVVFGKIPGRTPCKTRLQDTANLSEEETTSLARAFLCDSLRTALESTPGAVFFAAEPVLSNSQLGELLAETSHPLSADELERLRIFPQENEDFGLRLEKALMHVSEDQQSSVVVIGTDAPSLPASSISAALETVEAGDIALGPTPGGGLYLIGIPQSAFEKGLSISNCFSSGNTEFEQLVELADKYRVRTTILPLHCDIDIAEDLVSLLPILTSFNKRSPSFQTSFADCPATRSEIAQLRLGVARSEKSNRSLLLVR